MTDDHAFLAAIARAPADAVVRLVYADWLEERDDPRAELIRVEEEMRPLPVFADRYWQLKPRRNELRALAADRWREAMGYTTVRPVFAHGVPDDVRGRWRLIREFVERWYGHALPDLGGQADTVRGVEEHQLGLTLSPSVREWVAFVTDLRRAGGGLRDGGYTLQGLEGHAAVSLLMQAEADYHWAVRREHWEEPDPPVHGFTREYDTGLRSFVPDDRNPVANSTSAFALHYVVNYLQGKGGGFGVNVADPSRLRAQLRAAFPQPAEFHESEYYEADNLLVRLSDGGLFSRGWKLEVEAAKPLARDAIPAFLWGCTNSAGVFRGMFTPDRHRPR